MGDSYTGHPLPLAVSQAYKLAQSKQTSTRILITHQHFDQISDLRHIRFSQTHQVTLLIDLQKNKITMIV